VPGLENGWVAAGFYSTGLLMAPIVGRLLADAISDGAGLPPAFGLSRFE
jgi:glycine/D-amino acid oxidase-like deaminating enzyme